MKKILKSTSLFLLLSIGILIFTGIYFDIQREKLETKYATGASQFLDLPDGARIHFRDEGKTDKPAIVLLHGFNGSLLNFERLVPLLANNFRLVSLDLPGFGLTGATPNADYTTKNYMDTVTSITNYLGINKFSIAGNSMGGGVAWRYAIEYPSKVEGLILLASSGVMTKEDRDRLEQRKDAVFLPVDFEYYEKITEKAMKIMKDNADIFEYVGRDEAYLDVTKRVEEDFTKASHLAQQIKNLIRTELKLSCSIGVSSNKLISKIASDYQKPDGLTIVNMTKLNNF